MRENELLGWGSPNVDTVCGGQTWPRPCFWRDRHGLGRTFHFRPLMQQLGPAYSVPCTGCTEHGDKAKHLPGMSFPVHLFPTSAYTCSVSVTALVSSYSQKLVSNVVLCPSAAKSTPIEAQWPKTCPQAPASLSPSGRLLPRRPAWMVSPIQSLPALPLGCLLCRG